MTLKSNSLFDFLVSDWLENFLCFLPYSSTQGSNLSIKKLMLGQSFPNFLKILLGQTEIYGFLIKLLGCMIVATLAAGSHVKDMVVATMAAEAM